MRRIRQVLSLIAVVCACLFVFTPTEQPHQRASSLAAAHMPPHLAGWALPFLFVSNVGQSDPQVRFLAHGRGATLFITDDGASLVFAPRRIAKARAAAFPGKSASSRLADVIRLRLDGIRKKAHPEDWVTSPLTSTTLQAATRRAGGATFRLPERLSSATSGPVSRSPIMLIVITWMVSSATSWSNPERTSARSV